MKILAITDLSGHMVGGPSTAAIHLLNGLAGHGHAVTLANDHPYPRLMGVAHASLQVSDSRHLRRRVSTLIDELQPDIVHLLSMGQRTLRTIGPALSTARWVLTVHSVPPYERILAAAHGHDSWHYRLRNAKYAAHAAGWRLLLRRLDIPAIVAHSPFVSSVLKEYGAPNSNVHVIDLAVGDDTASCSAVKGSAGPRIVTVAGIAHTKGLHDAIAAIGRLRSEFPTIHYRIVGEVRDASYLRHLHALIEKLRLRAHVQISERVPAEEKTALLEQAELYLQPSHEEGFCLAYLEAALTVPRLVGTETGAIRRISQGLADVRVVAARDVDAMSRAIAELLRRPERAEVERSVSRARLLAQYSWNKHVAEHESLYRSIARAGVLSNSAGRVGR